MDSQCASDAGVEPIEMPKPKVKINSLSDKEILFIFKRLPLCDLETQELVSRRFRRITLGAYSDRRSLSLLQTPQYRMQLDNIGRYWYFTDYTTRFPFGEDSFRVTRKVNSIGVKWFGERFPNVTQLTLYCVDHLSLDRFVELIRLYPSLEHLVLFCTHGQQRQYNQTQFWNAIYGLRKTLRHLSLPFGFKQNITAKQLTPLFTSEIKDIFFKYPRRLLEEKYLLAKKSNTLERFGLWRTIPMDTRLWYWMLFEQPNPTERIVGNEEQDKALLTRYGSYGCDYIPSAFCEAIQTSMVESFTDNNSATLTHVDLMLIGNAALLWILPDLAKLTRLTNIRFTELATGKPPTSDFFSGLTRDNYRAKLSQPGHTLPTVQYLHLSKFAITPTSGVFTYFPVIFPHIHTLHLEDCPMVESLGKGNASKWFLKSLQRFDQLRQVYHNQRLVLKITRATNEEGDQFETDKLIQLIEMEMFKVRL